MTIGFTTLVTTSTIRIFSTGAIDSTLGKWTVATSLSNLESEFGNASFEASISTVDQAIVPNAQLPGSSVDQFRYTLTVGTPSIDSTGVGLPYWRVTHQDAGAFDDVSEVQILEPLTPTITYFDTDGSFASSSTFEKSNILDAAYDNINNVFYTIRYNSDNVGTTTVTLNDDFSDADAGTASGTNNFNPSRWEESNVNTQFLRASDQLIYNTATGDGQLETTYDLSGDINVMLDVDPQTLTSKNMWMSLRALTSDNVTIMSEGVGYETSPTVTGVWFSNYVSNIVDSAADCTLREVRPLWHNSQIGTDSFTLAFNGSAWTVSGTLTGALTNATTGVIYDESTEANTPLEFLLSCTASPNPGDNFTFDLITSGTNKIPTATGILQIARAGSDFTSGNVMNSPDAVSTADVSIELFGNTNGTINISSDNYEVVTGSGVFADVAVFTVEKTDNDGLVTNPPLIESFDIIGDPILTYNSFLDGRVQIAATASGGGGGFIYLKIDNELYKYANNIALGTETGGSALASSIAQISQDGTNSFNWTHRSGIDH
jgi:hypothetical protein